MSSIETAVTKSFKIYAIVNQISMLMSQKYPVGIETFADIIEGRYAYADKTEIIYKLIQTGKYFFLSRPRRFGKSLMLSTMQAYFEGRKHLFEGLWLGGAEGVDWAPRPVLRLNFVNAKAEVKDVEILIAEHLRKWESMYNMDATEISDSLGQRFFRVIERAYEVTGQKVAVLIDEYDKVLVNTMDDEIQHEEMKRILKPVFGTLKGADAYIEFAMLTGVSRFSRLSIFSDLNNINDISLDDRFCTLCGITEAEMRRYFAAGITRFAEKENTDFEGMVKILKKNYDGYHFSENCPDIYNPFSLINALDAQKILHRWFESGTPTFLIKMMRDKDEDIREILNTESDSTSLASSDTIFTNLTALLFQTGYLTIKGYDPETEEYLLGVPNREVSFGLFRHLLPEYSGQGNDPSMRTVRAMRKAINGGQPEEMMEILKTFISRIPYTLSKGRAESYFQNNLYIIFSLLGFTVDAEYTTARGRIDILLKTPHYIYVMELKLDGTPEAALQQIEEMGYCDPFAGDPRTLYRIGISYSKRKRNIDRWKIV